MLNILKLLQHFILKLELPVSSNKEMSQKIVWHLQNLNKVPVYTNLQQCFINRPIPQ